MITVPLTFECHGCPVKAHAPGWLHRVATISYVVHLTLPDGWTERTENGQLAHYCPKCTRIRTAGAATFPPWRKP